MTRIDDVSTSSIYDRIWEKGSANILNGQTDVDHMIDDANDQRRGITLILRPGRSTLAHFRNLISALEDIEPGQYCYADSEIHITVLSIISCSVDYDRSTAAIHHIRDVTRHCVANTTPFDLAFHGVTMSAGGVLAQGFDASGALDQLRHRLRAAFLESSGTSVDQRYVIKTAHSTLMRFRKPVEKAQSLVDFVAHRRKDDFGTSRITRLELVENDWYHAAGKVELIERLHLQE